MKPPVDWSPCQQRDKEHDWQVWKYKETSTAIQEPQSYVCINCGVLIAAFGRDFNA